MVSEKLNDHRREVGGVDGTGGTMVSEKLNDHRREVGGVDGTGGTNG